MLFRQIFYCILFLGITHLNASVEDSANNCPCPWIQHEDNCYLLSGKATKREDAEKNCQGMGGDLAVIEYNSMGEIRNTLPAELLQGTGANWVSSLPDSQNQKVVCFDIGTNVSLPCGAELQSLCQKPATAKAQTCQLVFAMNRLSGKMSEQSQPQLTAVEVNNMLEASAAANPTDGETKTVSFLMVVQEPPLAMGTFAVESSYNPSRAPAGGAEVGVSLEVLAVTRIDSAEKTAGVHMALTIAWQDPRIKFKTREPNVKEEFEFSPDVLK